jgi:protein SCO1/2
MENNKSYIWISFIVLIFGIYAVPKIINRINNGTVVNNDRLDNPNLSGTKSKADLVVVGPVKDFSLIDQNSLKITNTYLLGKVYVVEFFFTKCPTICPIMNRNMVKIQSEFSNNPNFGIVSITIDPEHDTPEVLKEHAKALQVTSSNWHFLTGDKNYIMDLSNKGFNLYAAQNPKIQGGFEHSGLFALIDKKGNVRARKDNFGNVIVYYDGIKEEGIAMLKNDIKLLLKE